MNRFDDEFQERAHAPWWTPAGWWQRLSSMRFALWLLLILAVGSVLGIIVGDQYPTNVPGWQELARQKAGPVLYPILDFFHMFDATRSWWYRLLIGLLSLSLLACVAKRSRGAWKRAMHASFLERPEYYERYDTWAEGEVDGADPLAPFAARLRAKLFRVRRREGAGGAAMLAANRGGLTRFGPISIHIGILLLVVGGLVSALFGLKTMAWLEPGDEIDAVDPLYFAGGAENPDDQLVDLPYSLRLDDFRIELNDRGMVKQYVSTVEVIPHEGGGEPFVREISVNHPLRRGGFNFYQASYQASARSVRSLQVSVQDTTGATLMPPRTVELGERFPLPGDGLEAVAQRFVGHAMVGEHGVYNASFEHRNPAVLFQVLRGDDELWSQWSFVRFPEMHMGGGHALNLVVDDYEPAYATGLEVTRAPAAWIIWAGIVVTTLGLILSFFFSHRQVWVLAEPAGERRWRVRLAAFTNRDRSVLGRDLGGLIGHWRRDEGVRRLVMHSAGDPRTAGRKA